MREDVVVVVAEILEVVARLRRKAAPMREQIGDRDVLSDVRVAEREGRRVPHYGVVPRQLLLSNDTRDHRRRDRLCR